jgi:aspartyl protease family protein
MQSGDSGNLIYLVAILVFVASGLFARRESFSNILKYAIIWCGIFVVGFVLFSFRGDFTHIFSRVKSELSPSGSIDTATGSIRLRIAEDGHFWAKVNINGQTVTMLVDSGATTTTLSSAMAKLSRIPVDRTGMPVIVSTANGLARSWRATVEDFSLSGIRRENFSVHVSEMDDTDVIGMNFLSTLQSWRVEGDEMVLIP